MKFRVYKKDFDYSYTLGIFLTIELLENRVKDVISVIISSKATEREGGKKVISMCKEHQIPYEINDKMIEVLSPKENCYVIGVFNKYQERLNDDSDHVVLVNPMDSGNLGTITRSSLGFGIKNIAIIKPAVDIYDPKTVRASMGALFHISFEYFDSIHDYMKRYEKHHLYPFMLNAKMSIHDLKEVKSPYALTFGNESSGLDDSFQELGTSVIIPHSSNIDSLNLSIAVGIAVYEFTKQNFTIK